ncbi:AvrD family protein [Enterococcus termitis]
MRAFETRYFGAGHKNTEYSLVEGVETNGSGSELVVVAQINQSCSWSVKDGESQKPHLSTVDGLILAVLAAESYLCKYHPEINLEDLYLSSFEIKAGVVPVEDLRRIPMNIEKVIIHEESQRFTVFILGMRISVELRAIKVAAAHKHNKEQAVNYMADHLKHVRHDIQNIDIYNGKEMMCEVTRATSCKLAYSGIGSKVSKAMSLIEWLIIFSQMSQIVAYNFDDIERKYSDTFWMRLAKAEMDEPMSYSAEQILVSGGINKTQIISMNNENWRTFNMAGETADSNVRFTGKLAHKVPNKETGGSEAHV